MAKAFKCDNCGDFYDGSHTVIASGMMENVRITMDFSAFMSEEWEDPEDSLFLGDTHRRLDICPKCRRKFVLKLFNGTPND